jgi:SAM-dependent MidA family methyltransferase
LADALRAAKLDSQFLASIEVVLIETSARLRETQAEKLKATSVSTRWLERFDESLTDMPLFLLANEFFDALPIRQFVFMERGWCERMVGVEKGGALAFGLEPAFLPLTIPAERGVPELGAVYETCPAAEELAGQIARNIAQKGGAALIFDYGYDAEAGFGDTLQAVARHGYASLLDNPGEADLSAHVNFAALTRAAERAGARTYGPISQGGFLVTLGIAQRAEALSRRQLADAPSIRAQMERLSAPEQMGRLFKTLAILPAGAPCPEGF